MLYSKLGNEPKSRDATSISLGCLAENAKINTDWSDCKRGTWKLKTDDVPGCRITMSLSSFQSLERGYNHLYFYSAEVHCTQYKHAIIYQNDIFVWSIIINQLVEQYVAFGQN